MNAFEEDIKNKEMSTLISSYLCCQLCKMISKIPSICTKCGYLTCFNCINQFIQKNPNKSPCGCNKEFFKSKLIENSIKKLIFKCHNNCGDENIKYDELEQHYKVDCKLIPYNILYSDLLNEYEELEKKLNDIKSSNKSLIYNTKFHLHPLTLCVTDRPWLCDNCRKSFSKKEKSYFCSLCDFDLYKNCLL